MTREEIIHGLYRGDSKAIKEAIKTLEQECDDAISRQAVKNILPRQKFVSYEAYLSCANDIDKLPSVTPIRPKGHWIDYSEEGFVECPECGIGLQDWHRVERNEDDDISFHEYEFKYCPNCGARIRSE